MTLKMIKKDEPIRTGADIANEITSYEAMHEPSLNTDEYKDLVGKTWVDLEWIIDKGRELCFCPECFAVMGCYEHLCGECRSRVGVPWDAEIFIQWIEKRVKEG